MKDIKLKIQSEVDREKIISALANNGFKVWVEEDYDIVKGTDHYVLFEY